MCETAAAAAAAATAGGHTQHHADQIRRRPVCLNPRPPPLLSSHLPCFPKPRFSSSLTAFIVHTACQTPNLTLSSPVLPKHSYSFLKSRNRDDKDTHPLCRLLIMAVGSLFPPWSNIGSTNLKTWAEPNCRVEPGRSTVVSEMRWPSTKVSASGPCGVTVTMPSLCIRLQWCGRIPGPSSCRIITEFSIKPSIYRHAYSIPTYYFCHCIVICII